MNYDVHLEMFEGPLDLLLFLIKKDDLDIRDIPIARITQEYLSYLDVMKELNLDVAGEFLVLASTLMAIKAQMLLPRPAEEAEEGPDPRAELMARLLEYQKFKEAASFLEKQAAAFDGTFFRGLPHFDESEKILSVGVFDLLSALKDTLERAADAKKKEVLGEEFPIEEKIEKILFMLEKNPSLTWSDLFAEEIKKRGVITCFLALLELVKEQRILVRQDEPFGPIRIHKRLATEAAAAAETPQVESAAPSPLGGESRSEGEAHG